MLEKYKPASSHMYILLLLHMCAMQTQILKEQLLCYYAVRGHIPALKALLQIEHNLDPNVQVGVYYFKGGKLCVTYSPISSFAHSFQMAGH